MASVALLAGGWKRRLVLVGMGVALVELEIASVWRAHELRLAIADAVAGLILLAAFELRSWAIETDEASFGSGMMRAQLRRSALRFATIVLVLIVLVVSTRGFVSGPLMGIIGGCAVLALAALFARRV